MHVRVPIPSGGEMPGYLALPKRPGAAVVVIQEIFGVTPAMKETCDWLASRQFVALCPELFWRTDPGLVLKETERDRAIAARGKVDNEQAAADIAGAIDYLRQHPHVNAGVGVVGYCWGGLLSFLTAAKHKPDAAVSYYGVGVEKHLDKTKDVACPMLFHYAELDKLTSPEVIGQVSDAFQGNAHATIHTYKGADHAFARPGGHNYHHASADLANMRTLGFFVETMVGRR